MRAPGEERSKEVEMKHHIRNQLSNITLALEQLKYELHLEQGSDMAFYLETIELSCKKINILITDAE